MTVLKEILLVDAKTSISWAFNFILASNGYLVTLAPDVETASQKINHCHFDLILIYLPGYDPEKINFLQQLQSQNPQPMVMVIGDPRTKKLPIEVFQIEVEDYLFLPFDAGELCQRVACCLEKQRILPPDMHVTSKIRRAGAAFETVDLWPL